METVQLRAFPDPKRKQLLVPVSVKVKALSPVGHQVNHWNSRVHRWHRGRIG
jgi:hypothetical protein